MHEMQMAPSVSVVLLLVAVSSPTALALSLPWSSSGNETCDNSLTNALVSIFSPDSAFSTIVDGALTLVDFAVCPAVPKSEEDELMKTIQIYYCYNSTAADCQIEKLDNISNVLTNSHWNKSRKVCIFFPGWTNGADSEGYSTEVMKAYYKNNTYNLLIVDWPKINKQFYTKVVSLMPAVAQKLADAFKKLAAASGGFISSLFLIGHSLGAHLAGYTGRLLKGSVDVPVIYAMDPAGPCFTPTLWQCQEGLRATDADKVISVHSDWGRFGTNIMPGVVAYFPNNGTVVQPDCTRYDVNPKACNGQFLCSHRFSLFLWCDAVSHPGTVLGRWCPSQTAFAGGLCTDFTTSEITSLDSKWGTYFLTTDSERPFGKGTDGT